MVKRNGFGRWWHNHWDEVMLVSVTVVVILGLLHSMGRF
jgi:hypothetical protein